MIRKFQKIIAIILLVFVAVTFIGVDFARAQDVAMTSSSHNDKATTKDSLTILGAALVVGLSFKIFNNFSDNKEYEKYLKEGQKYLDKEKYSSAISEFKKAKDLKDSSKVKKLLQQAYIGKGKINSQEENYKLAIQNFEKAKKYKKSDEVNQLLDKAKTDFQAKHYQQAISYQKQGELVAAYQELKKVKTYGNYKDLNSLNDQVYQELRKVKLQRIAVLDFEDTTYGYGNLGSKVAGLFTGELLAKNLEFIEIVEREQLNSILNEQKLSSASGLVDESTAKELGNILGVDYIVVGKILSADVDTETSSEYEEEYDASEGEYVDKKIYTKEKEAYTQIIFKLLNVSTGQVVSSKTIKKTETDSETYEQGEEPILISNNKLFDQVLTDAVAEFADLIHNKYEL